MKDTILEKDTILITVGDDHTCNCTAVTIGRTGENAVTQLEFTIPAELNKFWAYLDFKKPKGLTFKTPQLDIVDNKIEYDIPNELLDENGNIEVQLVLHGDNGEIWKSATKKFVVLKSIDAGEDIPEAEDFVSDVINTLQEIENAIPKTIHVVYEDINGNATLPDAMEWYKAHPLDGCYIGSQTGYSEPILVKSYSQTAFTLHIVEYNYWEMDEENYGDSAYWVEIFDSEYITSKIDEHDKQIGNVDKALDSIIAIQNSLIGGESV